MDLAVGVIIGAGVRKNRVVVGGRHHHAADRASCWATWISPNLFVSLNGTHYDTLAAAKAAGAPTVNYGLFLNTIINFLIVAFAVFLLVQQVNRWAKKPAAGSAPPTTQSARNAR